MIDQFYSEFKRWISQMSDDDSFTDDIKAINFGIFESENSYVTYCVGSKTFHSENDDWACSEDFVPNKKYLNIPSKLTENKNWEEIQILFRENLNKYMSSMDYEYSILSKVKNITFGFDDSELIKIK